MINRKIILSSVIAGVVSLSASQHVTAALPNFQQGQEGVHVNNQNMQVVQQRPPVQLEPVYNMIVARCLPDKQKLSEFAQVSKKCTDGVERSLMNPVPVTSENYPKIHNKLETQAFYTPNDFRLLTNSEDTTSNIFQARFEYPMGYDDVKRIVAIDGQHYNKMTFTNVSMSINDALAISKGEKNGKDALHYNFDKYDNINRFYLDKNETQEILIKHLNFGDLTDLRGIDLSIFSHILPSFGVRLGSEYGSYAALSFTNIQFMDLPAGVNYIPNNTFNHSSIIFLGNTNKIEHIGYCAFEGTRITEMDLTNCCTLDISSFAFCKVLKKVIFGSKLKTIPNYCFYECETLGQEDNGILNLTNVDVLEDFCFAKCPKIHEVLLSDRLINKVPEHAFDEKVVITYVDANGKMVAQ